MESKKDLPLSYPPGVTTLQADSSGSPSDPANVTPKTNGELNNHTLENDFNHEFVRVSDFKGANRQRGSKQEHEVAFVGVLIQPFFGWLVLTPYCPYPISFTDNKQL